MKFKKFIGENHPDPDTLLLNNFEQMCLLAEKYSKALQLKQASITAVNSRFVSVKLNREIVEGMISTYEFLLWKNKGTDDAKDCKKILNALRKSLV
jgi:hypothetical protein